MVKILGISAFYHDSAASLIVNEEIIASAQEERFTRIKHTAVFPVNAIKYCLEEANITIDELDAIVYYEKPLLKFERLLETYYAFAPKGLFSFIKAIPIWLEEKLFIKRHIYKGLNEVGFYNKKKIKLLFSEHHLSHAGSAFFASPFNSAAILTIDGAGEWSTTSIGLGQKNQIKFIKELHFPHSVGLLYSAFTYYLGFTVNSGEYKLMGLAPYGDPQATQTKNFIEIIKSELVSINDDGSIWLNQKLFHYATGLRMIKENKWKKLFGFPTRKPKENIEQHHCNLALAIQQITEEIVIKLATEAKKVTGAENLCLAGGVALNCVANGKLLKENLFKEIFVQPASGDAGGALGAALVAEYMYFAMERKLSVGFDLMQGSYLGPEYIEAEVQKMNRKVKAVYKRYEIFQELLAYVSSILADGYVVGWFQGRMEFGPRALGNRSILGDARNEEMQKKLNLKIKNREGFRPFAPSVLAEDAQAYFDLKAASQYMLFVAPVKAIRRTRLPENFNNLSLLEKLYYKRSDIQTVTHVDFSARVQTVHKETNLRYWELINEFKRKTGYGLLVNTSFNIRGEPIVCTPFDAYRCFMSTDLDFLVINNFIYTKKEQPDWENREKWRIHFKLD